MTFTGYTNPQTVTDSGSYDTYAFGNALAGTPGNYKLCFAWDASYLLEVGTLSVVGPVVADHACTLSNPCELTIDSSGSHNLSPSNKLLVIKTPHQCGDADSVAADFGGSFSNPKTPTDDANDNLYPMGTATQSDTAPGVTYRLCWAGSSAANAVTDFMVQIDAGFVVNGAAPGAFECVLGKTCQIQLTGFGMVSDDRLGLTR